MEPEKVNFEDFTLVNNFNLSDVQNVANEIAVEVIGLGKVTPYQYTYNDICPNSMK